MNPVSGRARSVSLIFMDGQDVVLVVVVVAALWFDFTNGFHDTASAMYRRTRRSDRERTRRGFRIGQVASASLVALAHGTNDAQKTMGVIMLALIANGSLASDADVPVWVVTALAAIAAVVLFVQARGSAPVTAEDV